MKSQEHSHWRTRGYLPHLDDQLQRQFITYRLGDSLPRHVQERLAAAHDERDRAVRKAELLDAGYGACILADPRAAEIVVANWRHHDGELYRLRDWVVMPNHVHVDIEPCAALSRIVHAWKSYTSKAIKVALDRREDVWHREYFDRFHRNRRHSAAIQCYIYLNPVRAGLVDDPFDWEWSSIHRHSSAMRDEIRAWYRRWRARFHSSVHG